MIDVAKSMKFSLFFIAIFALAAVDIWFDFGLGVPAKHLLFEFLILFLSLVGLNYFGAVFLRQHRAQRDEVKFLQSSLAQQESMNASLSSKVKSYREELRLEVAGTFKDWGLTKAEVNVAGLLLKGLSLKEIAEVRHSNERTIRSQCTAIYRKSKLSNRSQLSSYFLDDLV